jgi:fimbrial isopeptide formation D2 family protein/LPXTG-motif cell wall-anchored protein
MKRVKQVLGVVFTLVMIWAMSVVVLASDSTTITKKAGNNFSIVINNSLENHTYSAYQIFSGDLAEQTTTKDGKSTSEYLLSNIQWGSGVTITSSSNLKSILGNDFDGKTASQVADIITSYSAEKIENFAGKIKSCLADNANATANQVSGNVYTLTGLAPGYYLIVDSIADTNLTNTTSGTNSESKFIVALTKDTVTIDPKISTAPTVVKKVEEINDSTTAASSFGQSADYDIGDSVRFQITASLPSDITSYDSYQLVFYDSLPEKFTYDSDKSEIAISVVTGENTIIVDASGYNASYADNMLTVTMGDILALKEKDKATSNDPKISVGTTSQIIITYKTTLNTKATIGSTGNTSSVYLTYSNNLNGKGKTASSEVTVYTYQLKVNKLDGSNNPLTGSGFTLYKYNANSKATDDESKYEAYSISGAEYTETEAATNASETGKVTSTGFTFTGLDAGKYKLIESTTPAGYNTAAPIYFEIEATYGTTPTLKVKNGETVLSSTDGTFTADWASGIISTKVVNNKGITLPQTGGKGTTLFYILGAALFVAAAVLLVTRRRMKHQNDN